MKSPFLVFFLALLTLLPSCASAPSTPPDWAGPAQNVNAVYPAEKFIAQKGTGADPNAAQVNALAAISRYFESEVESRVSSVQVITQQNGADEAYLKVEERGLIQSAVNLFALRQSETWFNKAENQWETVAYIDRDEAWTIYEPRLTQKTAPFMTAFRRAETEEDPLRQFVSFSALQDPELLTMLDFAQVLHPRKAQAFDDVRSAYSECRNKAEAAKRCQAVVTENEQKMQAGTFFTPTIAVTLSGKDGVIFTYNRGITRTGAKDPAVAKRRAYIALGKALQETFWDTLVQDTTKVQK
ncbi:hypothetical protein AGMMS49942_22250 [Spirochaetia bacterium]|nr:hypothetical protein AGMMS49942_22250 [Spirochaetia bacterium]